MGLPLPCCSVCRANSIHWMCWLWHWDMEEQRAAGAASLASHAFSCQTNSGEAVLLLLRVGSIPQSDSELLRGEETAPDDADPAPTWLAQDLPQPSFLHKPFSSIQLRG